MSTAIQRRRGTTAQHASFAGLNGELTVDTDKKTVVVHDGATAGGFPLARQDFSNVSSLALPAGAAATPVYSFTGDTNTGIYSPGADQVAISTGGSGRLFVDASGNVKVGSTDNSNAATQYITVGSVGVTDGGLQLWARTNGQSYVQFGDTTTAADQYRGYIQYQHVSDFLALGTASQERLRITSAGLVGVGTSSPEETLDANGAIVWRGGLNSGKTSAGALDRSGNELRIRAYGATAGTGQLVFRTGGGGGSVDTEAMRIDASQRVGIGTSSPSFPLHVSSANTQVTSVGISNTTSGGRTYRLVSTGSANSAGAGTFGIYDDDASAFRAVIDSSGRVGIGSNATSPAQQLHVRTDQAGYTWTRIDNQSTSASAYAGLMLAASGNTWGLLNGSSAANGNALSFVLDAGGANSEKMRLDTSGRLLLGTSTARSNIYLGGGSLTPQTQFEYVANSYNSGLSLINYSASGYGPSLTLGLSLSNTQGTNTSLVNGSDLGIINFVGNDGTNFRSGAYIYATVDGTPGTADLPTALKFSTTADGASGPTERMRITQKGTFKFSSTGTYYNATGGEHELIQGSNGDWSLRIQHNGTTTNPYGQIISYPNATPNSTGNEFLYCVDSTAVRAIIRSNGGLANYSANNANLSDRNSKKDITPAAGTWDCIKEWEIVNYRYKDQPDDADLNLGVIAQQVAESCPEVITVFQEAKEATEDQPAQEERLGIKEQQMYWMAIKALQEAQVRIEALEAEVAALKVQ